MRIEERTGEKRDYPMISFQEWLVGAHCKFKIPYIRDLPQEILNLAEQSLRQRASEAWDAAETLQAAWSLWTSFMFCGSMSLIPDAETQSLIAERFPELAAIGPVLEALSPTNTLRGQKKCEREFADERAEIERGRTRRMTRKERVAYRGVYLEELLTAFQREVTVSIQSLWLLELALPAFQRPMNEILSDASIPMAVSVDTARSDSPVDFADESSRLKNSKFLRVRSAIEYSLTLLECRPMVAFKANPTEPTGHPSFAIQQLNVTTERDGQADDSESVCDPSRPIDSCFLGLNTDCSSRKVTRNDLDETIYLSPVPFNIVVLLIAAAGEFVSFEKLESAWPEDAAVPNRDNIHSAVSKMNKEIGELGIYAANKRAKGYRLVDSCNAESPE